MNNKQLILLELNEVNFNIAKKYVARGGYPNIKKLISLCSINTLAEKDYRNLEPWIQWPSVHCGLTFFQHKIFRLGDVLNFPGEQIFEKVESLGYRVGCVSPMNATNRLVNPAYFIPDPWTETSSDSSWWSKKLTEAISQAVNDNSKKELKLNSLIVICLSFLRFASLKHYTKYLKYAITAKWRPWRRALFLDLLLHDVHITLYSRKKPNLSVLFLNACAHIQHHYFFNSPYASELNDGKVIKNPEWYISESSDPVEEALNLYDLILGEYLSNEGWSVIVATGLTQIPYGGVKYYYRLRSHENFLGLLGITCDHVVPLMTRDFVIYFLNKSHAEYAYDVLVSLKVNDEFLFGEIDNRGLSLFVTLTYPNKINETDVILFNEDMIFIYPHVSFVAIKNGMHNANGFAYFSKNLFEYMPKNGQHVKCLYDSILQYFK
jgi:hypothetical protein